MSAGETRKGWHEGEEWHWWEVAYECRRNRGSCCTSLAGWLQHEGRGRGEGSAVVPVLMVPLPLCYACWCCCCWCC